MEPLDLGPNAGSHARAPPLPAVGVGTQRENDDVYEVGDRFSLEDLSLGSGRVESHGISEVLYTKDEVAFGFTFSFAGQHVLKLELWFPHQDGTVFSRWSPMLIIVPMLIVS